MMGETLAGDVALLCAMIDDRARRYDYLPVPCRGHAIGIELLSRGLNVAGRDVGNAAVLEVVDKLVKVEIASAVIDVDCNGLSECQRSGITFDESVPLAGLEALRKRVRFFAVSRASTSSYPATALDFDVDPPIV
jgi:hypothetical protein